MSFTAKSVILDCADSHFEGAPLMGLLSFEMKLGGTLVDITADDILATYLTVTQQPGAEVDWAFITGLSKTGEYGPNMGLMAVSANPMNPLVNVRIVCVFTSPKTFDELVVNNFHSEGEDVTLGINNVAITISDNAITSTVYGEEVANSTLVFDDVFAAHVEEDVVDDQVLTLIMPPVRRGYFLYLNNMAGLSGNIVQIQQQVSDINVIFAIIEKLNAIQQASTITNSLGNQEINSNYIGLGNQEINSNYIGLGLENTQRLLNIVASISHNQYYLFGLGAQVELFILTGLGVQFVSSILIGFGLDFLFKINSAFGVENKQKLLLTYGTFLYSIQASLNKLQLNDEYFGTQVNRIRIVDGITKIYSILGYISPDGTLNTQKIINEVKGVLESITSENIQALKNKIQLNDEYFGTQVNRIRIVDGITKIFTLLEYISPDGTLNVQKIINDIKGVLEGETSENIQALKNKIQLNDEYFGTQANLLKIIDGNARIQSILEYISPDGANEIQRYLNTIAGNDILKIQSVLNNILLANEITGFQNILESVSNLSVTSYLYSTDVYIDGLLINNLVGSNTIIMSFSQSNIHNEITISSISEELFLLSDPSVNPGTPRIEVHVGTRVIFFLIERREGSSAEFTIWGRDQTARDSSPWSEVYSVSLTAPELASSVVASITRYSAITWDIYDWLLPIGFEATGTASEIISTIAQEIGAIVRSQDDGSFLIRKNYTTRPVNLPTASPILTYLGNIIVDFSHNKIIGDHYNKVEVTTYSPDSGSLQIEVEDTDTTLYLGDTAFVRVYWYKDNPGIDTTYVTDGSITKIVGTYSNETFQDTYTETIEFNDSIGETTYPIQNLVSTDVVWIGDGVSSGETLSWTQYEKTITVSGDAFFGLAEITYTVSYNKYQLSGHNVEQLLAVFFLSSYTSTDVIVSTEAMAKDTSGNLIDKVGSTIDAPYLTDTTSAVLRGEAWIDSNKYNSYEHGFKSPYQDNLEDGIVVWVDCDRIGAPGNFYVLGVDITISGPKVYNTLKVIQWEV